jgi:ribosomal protein S18 acetylase RimI-like enzyme
MKSPGSRFLVARNSDSQQVAAVAQWAVHIDDTEADMLETQQDRDERQRFEDELLLSKLPESSNRALIMEFTVGTRELRQKILQGRKHYLLENLATHPQFRGMGLASRLVEWVFPLADEQNLLVYLETASDNPAMKLYKKLGFKEQGHHTIEDLSEFVGKSELEACGSEPSHTHVAFIRHPHSATEPYVVSAAG